MREDVDQSPSSSLKKSRDGWALRRSSTDATRTSLEEGSEAKSRKRERKISSVGESVEWDGVQVSNVVAWVSTFLTRHVHCLQFPKFIEVVSVVGQGEQMRLHVIAKKAGRGENFYCFSL